MQHDAALHTEKKHAVSCVSAMHRQKEFLHFTDRTWAACSMDTVNSVHVCFKEVHTVYWGLKSKYFNI